MAGDVLLVHDDVVVIAAVRRLLARQGQAVILATSVADALIAFGHYAPSLVVLGPSVEGGRGSLVLRELAQHPNARQARVLLLGDGIQGSDAPVLPLPLDGTVFLERVSELLLAVRGDRDSASWVGEPTPPGPAPDWWHPTASVPLVSARPMPSREQEAPLSAKSERGGRAVTVATGLRSGTATQEELARLVANLSASRASCRLDLKTSEAQRVLWFRDGALVSATSSVHAEWLTSRARADGLIDRQQESEVRALRASSPAGVINALRSRGYLREVEVVPLVQRWTEQLAVEALGEPESAFRVTEPQIPEDALLAASPAPALQLLPRALERDLDEASLLAMIGGLEAIPCPLEHALEMEKLGLSAKQLSLLGAVDGALRVRDLLLSSGLTQKLSLQALHLGKVVGILETRIGGEPESPAPPELDLRRLRAKFEEVQDGDYFSVLGLARSAGAEDVRRAFDALSAEFNPLKFAVHPDASVRRQAQQVHQVLAEAAQALQDDQLRAGYSSSLVD